MPEMENDSSKLHVFFQVTDMVNKNMRVDDILLEYNFESFPFLIVTFTIYIKETHTHTDTQIYRKNTFSIFY